MSLKALVGSLATVAIGALLVMHDLGVDGYESNLDAMLELVLAFDLSSCSTSDICWSIATIYLALLTLVVCTVVWLFWLVRWIFWPNKVASEESASNFETSSLLKPNLTTEFLEVGMLFFTQDSMHGILAYANLHLKNSGVATTATNFKFYISCGSEKFNLKWWQPQEDFTLDKNFVIKVERLLLSHRGNYDVPQTKLLNQGGSEHGWVCISSPMKELEPMYQLIKDNAELSYVIEYEDTLGEKFEKARVIDQSMRETIVEKYESEWYTRDEVVHGTASRNDAIQGSAVIGTPNEYTVKTKVIDETGLKADFRQVGAAGFTEENAPPSIMIYANLYIINSGPPSRAMDFKFYIECNMKKYHFGWFQPDNDIQLDENHFINSSKLLLTHTEKYDVPETRIIQKGDSVLGWIIMYAPIDKLMPLYYSIKKKEKVMLCVAFKDLNNVATLQWARDCHVIEKGVVQMVENGQIGNEKVEG